MVRQPASTNRQPAAAKEPQDEEPPSPTSSISSTQLQKEVEEELGSPQVPKADSLVAGLNNQKANSSTPKSSVAGLITQKSNPTPETTTQSAPPEAEPKQIEAAPSSSSSANENGNVPTKETIMDESIRITRGRLRKTRSEGTR